MNKNIDTIVFDLGGVLIDWNPDYVYRHLFETEEEMQWFYKNICTPDWNEEQDAGRTLEEGTALLIKQFPEHEKNIRAYYDRWEEMLGGAIEGTVELFRKIKATGRYRTYALTNWSGETFPVALNKFEFLHWFDGRLVSGDEKMRKPALRFYELLTEKFDIVPENSIYIDDNPRNLGPASDIGFYTIHFLSPDELQYELEQLGVVL